MGQSKRAAIYARVSTADQTIENQLRELRAVAERRGWEVVKVYADEGISGSKGRDKRPALNTLLNDCSKGKVDIVMAWAVDRLGRSLIDLINTFQSLKACNVDLFLLQSDLDTTTPAGEAMFSMLGVFAQFDRSMIIQRTNAGLARARMAGKVLGRPKVAADKEAAILEALKAGKGMGRIAKEVRVGSGTVQRIARELRAASQ